VASHSVHLFPINVPWDNHDLILGVLFGIAPEVVVLSGSFQDELSIMRTRHLWPHTVHAVVAVAAGVGAFSTELAQIADGVLGSSQWEPGATFPNTVGRHRIGFWMVFKGSSGLIAREQPTIRQLRIGKYREKHLCWKPGS